MYSKLSTGNMQTLILLKDRDKILNSVPGILSDALCDPSQEG